MAKKKKKNKRKQNASRRKLRRLSDEIMPSEDLLIGNQRGASCWADNRYNDWDQEITITPVRDYITAMQVLEIERFSIDANDVVSMAVDDTFVSITGDEGGWTIADDLDDGSTIDTRVKDILFDIKNRHILDDYVVGGDKLQTGLSESLFRGDSFLEIGIEAEGISRNDFCVSRSQYLPTYEMFRIETDDSILLGFEQRRHLAEKYNDETDGKFLPYQIIHFRYKPEKGSLYGESVFYQAINCGIWGNIKDSMARLAFASRDTSQDPTYLTYDQSPGYDSPRAVRWRNQYRRVSQSKLKSDVHLPDWITPQRLGASSADIEKLIKDLETWRYQIIPARYAVYNFPGLGISKGGAREVTQAPERSYSRLRFTHCSLVSKGIRQILDTELTLKLGLEEFQRIGKYRIIWPDWAITTPGVPGDSGEEFEDLNPDGGNSNSSAMLNGKKIPVLGVF